MRVLVACEFSGTVRRAFRARGHEAWSCDLLPSEDHSEHHFTGRIQDFCRWGSWDQPKWDLIIAHPPCTYLANSGAKHLYLGMKKENGPNPERWEKMRDAAAFFLDFWAVSSDADRAQRLAIENPIMHGHAAAIISSKPSQIVQPWMFGHPERKATCFWLRNLPPLRMTRDARAQMVGKPKRETDRVHHAPPSEHRWKDRSRTYEGIAEAMAEQWGSLA